MRSVLGSVRGKGEPEQRAWVQCDCRRVTQWTYISSLPPTLLSPPSLLSSLPSVFTEHLPDGGTGDTPGIKRRSLKFVSPRPPSPV